MDANLQLHQLLGEEDFDQAWITGLDMSLDRMAKYAMEESVKEVSTGLVTV